MDRRDMEMIDAYDRSRRGFVRTNIITASVLMAFIFSLLFLRYIEQEEAREIEKIFPQNIIPLRYEIKLMLIDNENYYGESNISFNILTETIAISFHSIHLGINYQTTKLIIDNRTIFRTGFKHTYDIQDQSHTIHFSRRLPPGYYITCIKFIGTISDVSRNGFYRIPYAKDTQGNNTRSYMTNFRVRGARQIFPCWDHPALKAIFKISIRHPKDFVVLSNMRTLSTDVQGNHMWTYLDVSRPISPYLITLTIHYRDFVSEYMSIKNVYMYYGKHTNVRDMQFAQLVIDHVASNLEDTIKLLISWKSVNPKCERQVAIRPKLIVHRLEDILYNETLDPAARKMEVAYFIAYEMARLSFDNMLTPPSWSHLWINEGLSRLIALEALDKSFPEMQIMNLFTVQARHECFNFETWLFFRPLSYADNPAEIDMFYFIQYYYKAPMILRMLQHTFTTELFWNGIRKYLQTPLPVASNDLWGTMQSVLYEANKFKYNIRNEIGQTMRTWVDTSGYPIIMVERDYFTGIMRISIDNYKVRKWCIPLSIAIESTLDAEIKSPKLFWLIPEESAISIKGIYKNKWYLINLQQVGYYRIYYDDRNWRRLANYLKTRDYKRIPVLNRAQIIDDAYYFMMKGRLRVNTFLELTDYLRMRETDYVVWYPVIKALESLSTYFPYTENIYIKAHWGMILNGLLKKIGFNEKFWENALTKQLREEALRWACVLDNNMCLKAAAEKLKLYMADPLAHRSETKSRWMFCNGLISANADTWRKLFVMWINKGDNKTLEYLACSENPKIIYKYLKPLPSDFTYAIMPHYHVNTFLSVVTRHAKNNNILKFILKNFEEIKPRRISTTAAFIIIINNVYSTKQLEMIQEAAKIIAKENFSDIQYKLNTRLLQMKKFNSFDRTN